MTLDFEATISPEASLLTEVSKFSPSSPFNMPAYASALASSGAEPCILALKNNGNLIGGCLAALTGGKWSRQLEIFSAPCLVSPDIFWHGVEAFCQRQGVYQLDVQTFAAIDPSMPTIGSKVHHRIRSEYIVDLTNDDFPTLYSKTHKRHIKKASREGFEIWRSREFSDYQTHVQLMQASMARRSVRGEAVLTPDISDFDQSLLRTGLGELLQAKLDNQVHSSMLILRANDSGYYHSAGTSPEGMRKGASHFLLSQAASILAGDGFRTFNLGGVDPDAEGLRLYKSGFGAKETKLTAETFSMISLLERRIRNIARTLVNTPRSLLSYLRQ